MGRGLDEGAGGVVVQAWTGVVKEICSLWVLFKAWVL